MVGKMGVSQLAESWLAEIFGRVGSESSVVCWSDMLPNKPHPGPTNKDPKGCGQEQRKVAAQGCRVQGKQVLSPVQDPSLPSPVPPSIAARTELI